MPPNAGAASYVAPVGATEAGRSCIQVVLSQSVDIGKRSFLCVNDRDMACNRNIAPHTGLLSLWSYLCEETAPQGCIAYRRSPSSFTRED